MYLIIKKQSAALNPIEGLNLDWRYGLGYGMYKKKSILNSLRIFEKLPK
jgi:hypothetical protein